MSFIIFSIILREIDFENISLVLGEVLVVFVNRLTGVGRYPVQDCENLQLPIQIPLSEKRKILSKFFVAFLESTSNFQHFEKEDYSPS